jgi:hypothetical protein
MQFLWNIFRDFSSERSDSDLPQVRVQTMDPGSHTTHNTAKTQGRTGLRGRGVLGRWGPNHAADPIVTRWKRDNAAGQVVRDAETGRGILEFVSIERKDNGGWAIPGVCNDIIYLQTEGGKNIYR